jgi:hypothetical protein
MLGLGRRRGDRRGHGGGGVSVGRLEAEHVAVLLPAGQVLLGRGWLAFAAAAPGGRVSGGIAAPPTAQAVSGGPARVQMLDKALAGVPPRPRGILPRVLLWLGDAADAP